MSLTNLQMYKNNRISTYVCMYVCMFVCACVNVSVYVCMYVWANILRWRKFGRERERELAKKRRKHNFSSFGPQKGGPHCRGASHVTFSKRFTVPLVGLRGLAAGVVLEEGFPLHKNECLQDIPPSDSNLCRPRNHVGRGLRMSDHLDLAGIGARSYWCTEQFVGAHVLDNWARAPTTNTPTPIPSTHTRGNSVHNYDHEVR